MCVSNGGGDMCKSQVGGPEIGVGGSVRDTLLRRPVRQLQHPRGGRRAWAHRGTVRGTGMEAAPGM